MVCTRLSYCVTLAYLWYYTVVQASYRQGDIMLGGLFNAHKARGMEEGQCGEITKGSSLAEAMIFAIDNINSDPNLLPNISLGYDIRDCCEDNEKTARNTYELLENKCCANTTQNKRDKRSTVALIGPTYSTAAIFISGFLQMRNVTAISGTATSAELSSKTYQHLYRTVPSDTVLASAVADIIDHFHWTYVAAVGVDDSYSYRHMEYGQSLEKPKIKVLFVLLVQNS